MQVLKPVAAATSKVRALKGLSLKESVSQFSSTMTAQADLRVECAHLRRFYNNFASVSQSVTPPYPFPGCETAEVLIETFEPGEAPFQPWLFLLLSGVLRGLVEPVVVLVCFGRKVLAESLSDVPEQGGDTGTRMPIHEKYSVHIEITCPIQIQCVDPI